MPKGNIYARAAKAMERAPQVADSSSIYPCKHICDAIGVSFQYWDETPEVQRFLAAFSAAGDEFVSGDMAADVCSDEFVHETQLARDVCVLALCFAAAMADAGDL